MRMSPVELITIEREYGAGGGALAEILGERLGWRVVDHDVIHLVALRLHAGEEDVAAVDEHAPSFAERIAAALVGANPTMPIIPSAVLPAEPDRVAEVARGVLLEAARTLPVIMVGHGAQCLFRAHEDALHLRLVAPFEYRVRVVAQRTGLDPEGAAAVVRRHDADRHNYLRRYYQADWNDAHLYGLQFNSSRVRLQEAADMVVRLVHGRRESAG